MYNYFSLYKNAVRVYKKHICINSLVFTLNKILKCLAPGLFKKKKNENDSKKKN